MEIDKWTIISYWKWNIKHDTCAICRNSLQLNSIYNNNSICFGICEHVYHNECIELWLQKRPVCPLCNQNWKTKKISDI